MTTGLLIFILSCGDKSQPDPAVADSTLVKTDSPAQSSTYFPVYAFLSNEIDYVDSLPVGIMKYTTAGRKQDSGYIQLSEFHSLAGQFMLPEIIDSSFTKRFKESSFVDRSNGNATFYYKADDPSLQVRRVDIVTAKGDVYDEVKSIYMEKTSQNGDTFVVKKLYWKPKRNFQIITVTSDGAANKDEIVKVVWDNRE